MEKENKNVPCPEAQPGRNAGGLLRIAIDGPGGAGKSTIAKLLAKDLGIDYVDTGAMYRAIALKMFREGLAAEENEALAEMLARTEVDLDEGKILLDGEDVSGLIRTQEVSMMASASSALGAVRRKLVALQKAMGERKSLVMDGRDIGTNVLPQAEFKFYITAAAEERARRRYLELQEKGQEADYEQVLREINERDYNDMHRELDPLRKADDALEIDTTKMSIDEVLAAVKEAMQAD
ncbi:MAG: (d)CMP kinase [Firmicutes bacterium]|nr:(d)CMP kinase [Bacillota bacterium]